MSIFKARPTVYKGIQMRSRLEADYAASLERGYDTWAYEPKCFAGPEGQWLPDFQITTDPEFTWYVEVKPESVIVSGFAQILKRMEIARLSEPHAHLQLVFWRYGMESVFDPISIVSRGPGQPWEAWISPRTAEEMAPAAMAALAKVGLA